VHARGQSANVLTDTTIPVSNLSRAIAHHLPDDIGLVHIAEAPVEFHASRDALGKLYRYRIYNSRRRPVEMQRLGQVWHVWYPFDLGRMRAAAALMVGTHDYAGFASQGSPRATTVRTVERVSIRQCADELLIDVAGTGFLYNQVRNMVGTLFEIGRGHWPPEQVARILETGDRGLAGQTAPAQGLCLQWVRYGPKPRDMQTPQVQRSWN
jgi:tRNA pseudouridine38-40 synthase